ncbi:MAG: exodeoxyribonuclease V subunit alpha [Leptospirales bacterium]
MVVATDGFSLLERRFADWVSEQYSGHSSSGSPFQESDLLRLASATLIRLSGQGHICLDLSRLSDETVPSGLDLPFSRYPSLLHWESLRSHPSVSDGSSPGGFFVWEPASFCLYLRRFWEMELRVAKRLHERWGTVTDTFSDDPLIFETLLLRLFGEELQNRPVWQAVRRLLSSRLLVLTGGPGTGKTSTVARQLLFLKNIDQLTPLEIHLAAPTGRAARRLQDSLKGFSGMMPGLSESEREFLEKIPPATTVHKLLGFNPRSGYVRHDPEDPLAGRIVVVDEMSMMELPLFERLLAALSPQTRLVLLGDPDQLSSVGPGSVLGDIVQGAGENGPVVRLEHSWRFGVDTGIGRLAHFIRSGDRDAVSDGLWSGSFDGVEWVEIAEGSLPSSFFERVAEELGSFCSAPDPPSAFQALSRFRLLAAHREGEHGVSGLTRRLERVLERRFGGGLWSEGRFGKPLLILHNHPGLGLSNGDVGITGFPSWGSPEDVVFESAPGEYRTIPGTLLPQHATAFCLTVHKSQGSEFDAVYLVLPPDPSPVVTRELLYTAITRARQKVVLFGSRKSLLDGMDRRTLRFSGLSGRISAP